MKTTKAAWAFLAITFGLSWGMCGVAYALGLRNSSPFFQFLGLAMMLCPLLGALAAVGVGGWLSQAGGKIRHTEFRNGPPPLLPVTTIDLE